MDNYLEFRKKLGQKIKRLREAKGFSQEYVALEIDVDISFIGRIERSERNIGMKNLFHLAKVLEIPFSELTKVD